MDVAEVDEVGVGGASDCKHEIVKRSLSKNLNKATGYLIPNAEQAFIQLRQAFTKAPILRHFNVECHIRIKTDASGYAIGGVLSQLISNHLSQCYPIVYYLQKIIPAKTCYKTHHGELLAIVKAFKTWQHYLKGCKHELLILTNHNNFFRFIEIKNLSFCQVW